MEALPLHPFHFHFFDVIFCVLILWLASSCGACQVFKCGEYVFGYPFGWKNSGCGDPALQLDCDHEKQMPLINITGNQYHIMYPHTYVMPSNKLQGNSFHDMILTNQNLQADQCNPLLSNKTAHFWSSPQFRITGEYDNLILLQQCAPETIRDWSPLPCNHSWYYSSKRDSGLDSQCESRVVFPVWKPSRNISVEEQIIVYGFDFLIRWNVSENCTRCDSSGGRCVYDNRSMEICYKSKSNIIIIGCSIGSVMLAAVTVRIYIFYVRRTKSPPTRDLGNDFSDHHRSDMEASRPRFMLGSLSIFSYDELEQATNFFDEENELGDGGFGAVYLGKLQDGRVVAVKRLYQENSRRVEQFINEVQILSSLSHPSLVRLYGCTCTQSPTLLLVYEFLSNGTLWDHLHGSRRTLTGLDWGTRLNIAIETAQALAYLHSIDPPIYHRDVKSNNILLDENFRAKVADFGLSRLVPVNVSHVSTAPQGTPGYVDPEYHQCFQLTEKSDVYSFGVVLMEIISAKVAVDMTRNKNEIGLANMAIDKISRGVLDELVDPDLTIEKNHEVKVMVGAVAELAFKCLARDRDSRPGMKEVVSCLEEIKQVQESKICIKLMNVCSNSVQQKWPSLASNHTA